MLRLFCSVILLEAIGISWDAHEVLRLSPFSIGIYQQCPRRYKYHYVDGLIQQYKKPWPWLMMGQNVHAVLADFLSIIPIEKRTLEAIENLLHKKWMENRKGFDSTEEERQWKEKALAQLRQFINTQRIDVRPLMLERFHEAPVTEALILNGKIDRIDRVDDGSLHIIDYKTGNVPETVDSFQLFLYVLILSRTLTYPVSRASYLYLADGAWRTFPITDDGMKDARNKVLEIARQIKHERDYPEVVGSLCQFCDFLEICGTARESSRGKAK